MSKNLRAVIALFAAAVLLCAGLAGCKVVDKDGEETAATTATTAAATTAATTAPDTTAATTAPNTTAVATTVATTAPAGGNSTTDGVGEGGGSSTTEAEDVPSSSSSATAESTTTTEATTTAHVHVFGEWIEIIPPTCDDYGEEKRVCDCGEEEILPKSRLEHNYVGGVCQYCGREPEPSNGLDYHYDDYTGGYCVSIGSCRDTFIVIPSTYEGQPVTSICYKAFKESDITGIVLPSTLTYIDDNAFENCYYLTSIVIPEGVTHIGEEAFARCYELVSAVIPDSVTYIEDSAFNSCWALTDLTMGSGVTYIGRGAFAGCEKLPSVVLPDTLTELADRAFYSCGLTEITIPGSVELIGEECFDSCESLASVTFKKQNTFLEISRWAFARCTALTDIYVEGDISDWNNIGRWGNWNVQSAACTVHCNDGDIEAY